jgi:hypothetical protein
MYTLTIDISGWEMQQTVTILSVTDRTVNDRECYEKRRIHCVPLDIRGATGPRGGTINGVFDPTDEMRGGYFFLIDFIFYFCRSGWFHISMEIYFVIHML